MNNQHPYKSIKQIDNNIKSRFIPVAMLWKKCTGIARAGISRGFINQSDLFRVTVQAAHCCRGDLHLLDAHLIALEAVRHELAREVQA